MKSVNFFEAFHESDDFKIFKMCQKLRDEQHGKNWDPLIQVPPLMNITSESVGFLEDFGQSEIQI